MMWLHRPKKTVVRLFLRLVSSCYMFAFASIYAQIPGLYGPNGILPVEQSLFNDRNTEAFSVAALKKMDLLGVASSLRGRGIQQAVVLLGVSPAVAMEVVALIGFAIAAAITVFPVFLNKLPLAVLWYCHLSLFNHGQTFLWFQWDTLLLEVGFLAVVAAPFLVCRPSNPSSFRSGGAADVSPSDDINLFLVRWLLFRMMFASGVVKLTGGDEAWWGLTALPVHYESQCLPTFPAWFAYHMFGEWTHKVSVVMTYVIEIPLTFLFFAPTPVARRLAFAGQVFLMFTIMATGNYNFFNLLYIALCLSLAEDSWFVPTQWTSPRPRRRGFFSRLYGALQAAFDFGLVFAFAVVSLRYGFDFATLTPKLMFSLKEFKAFVAASSEYSIYVAGALLCLIIVRALVTGLVDAVGVWNKIKCTASTLCYAYLAVILFGVTVPTFMRGLSLKVPDRVPMFSRTMADKFHHLQLTHSYGLFRSMTGVGGRPEVIIEGANNAKGPWKEYHFVYKPGNLSAAPLFCLPHQPRLDWQMWFAALGSYQHNPWFINLVYRLLQNEPTVLKLLDKSGHPFPKRAPKYIRAQLYTYHFTDWKKGETNWWRRELKDEYLPAVSLDSSDLKAYVARSGIAKASGYEAANRMLESAMASLRAAVEGAVSHHGLVWSAAVVAATAFLITGF